MIATGSPAERKIHIWDWDEWAAKTVPVPLITGHEFAGEIVDLGRITSDFLDMDVDRVQVQDFDGF